MNAATHFLKVMSARSERTAIVEPGGRSITYAGLFERTVALEGLLRGRGLVPGDRVVLQVPNGIAFAAASIAVLLAGGVPVLLEPGLGEKVYLSRVRVASPRFLLVHPLLLCIRRVPGLAGLLQRLERDVPPVPRPDAAMQRIRVSDVLLERLVNKKPGAGERKITPADREASDDGILIFTGGTTDLPKGVRLGHGALDRYIAHISTVLQGLPFERFLADTPQQVLYGLRLGKTAYITRGRKQKRARNILQWIRQGSIDAYFGSPYVWTEMMACCGPRRERLPASLRTVLLGGAPVTRDFLERLLEWLPRGTSVRALYGMTEAGPVCAVRAEDKVAYRGEGDLVGVPLTPVRVEIDRTGGDAEIGEVVVHSPSLYTGYLGQPERGPREGLRTGDFGRLVTVGGASMLTLVGRGKDMIIRNGVNIYPLSFEPALRELSDRQGRPMLRECSLVGVWNPVRQDEDVVLCAQPAPGAGFSLDAVRKHAETVCGTDAKPDHCMVVDPIPVTGRQNKVDKAVLRRTCARRLGRKVPGP
jgi:acyl-CoA synthetase (AMP-forming)/AMP-acid ligase II